MINATQINRAEAVKNFLYSSECSINEDELNDRFTYEELKQFLIDEADYNEYQFNEMIDNGRSLAEEIVELCGDSL